MDPLLWLRTKFAEITGLPGRLQRIADQAHQVVRDSTRPMAERQRAGVIWAGAIADRAEVARILNTHLRPYDGTGLSALPLLAVYGTTAAALVLAIGVLFRRATAYELELRALASGHVTPAELESLRDDIAPVGVAASIRETTKLLTVAAVVAAAVYGLKRWGKR